MSFFEYGEGVPNDDEILLYELLLADPPDSVAELEKWAAAVRAQRSAAEEHAEKWSPAVTAEWPKVNNESKLYSRVRDALKRSYSDAELDNVGEAIATLGGHKDLTSVQLRAYLKGTNAKEPTIALPRPTGKGRRQPRWRSCQLLRIADGIHGRGASLRRALRGEEEQHLTVEEQLDEALELNGELLQEVDELEAEKTKLQTTSRQQKRRLGEHAAAKTRS